MTATLQELRQITAEIGRDSLLTQGAGGNTSIKCGDVLWVKASGAWMRDADTQQVFVSAPLPELHAVLHSGDDKALEVVSRACTTPEGLRPSIEAVLHAAMPHRAVIHAHAINSTVCAVLADGEERFLAAVAPLGLAIRFVPYFKPGLPLARQIALGNSMRGPADILLLQNHGIVVGADSPAQALRQLRSVESALSFPIRAQDGESAFAELSTEFEVDGEHSAIANDTELCAALTRAPLTPDQAVFLGGAPCLVSPGEKVDEAVKAASDAKGFPPMLAYLPGRGAMRRKGLTAGQRAQCDALAEIAKRLPRGADVAGLTADQVRELVDWEAERFRRSVDASRASKSDDARA